MSEDLAVKDEATAHPEPSSPGNPSPEPEQLAGAVEAILLTLDRPVAAVRLAEALGLVPPQADEPPPSEGPPEGAPAARPKRRSGKSKGGEGSGGVAAIDQAVETLNKAYAATGRSFRIETIAGGYRLMTLPAFAPAVAAFHRSRASAKLSRAAVETLAIIAYKQPITRAHLEAIRGVNCGEVLRSLMDRRLVTIKGRAEELGRPILYGTSKEFLDAFGLASLKDLPSATELQVTP